MATLVFKEHHENEISDKDLLLHDDNEEERHKVLKELRTNQSNDWFINLSLQSRLELLTLFCEQVLYGENFLKQKENLEGKVETMRAGLRDLKAKLKEDYDFALTLKCYTNKGKDLKLPKEILEDEAKKNAVLKIVQKIQDGEAKLKSAEHNLNKFSRIEPLTVDTNGYLYWHFSCIDGIILEKRSASDDGSVEAKSEWYSFTTPDELDNLIGLLSNEPENSKLVSGLKRKYEKLFGQKCRLELAKVKKEAKAKVDIGKMLMGETDAKVKLEGEETKNLNLRSLQFFKDDPENEKQAKYLSVGEIEEELAAEKPPGQFQTPIEKLLERILHNQQKAALNEEEYAAKKQETISSFFERSSKSFEEKFAFIQKLMIKSFDGFLNDGHLKEAILGEKADLWKKCVEESQSLSNLYYLNFLFTKQINWQIVNQKKKVKTVEMDDEEAELRARRRMARDELAESRPYSLRTLKKVAYDADEQLDKMTTEAEQQAEEEEPEQQMEVSPEGSEAVPSEDEAGSDDSDYEEEEEEPSKPPPPQRRSLRNNKSSSPEESGRRSQRLTKPGKTDEDDTTGRRRSARLIKTE